MDAIQSLQVSEVSPKIESNPSMNKSNISSKNILSQQNNINLKRTKMKKLMMGDNTNKKLSTDPLEVKSQEDSVDEDLKGIPNHILKIMEDQPIINIMTIGHVSHGKTTLMKALCNENTTRDSQGLKANKTIKLGYTSCKIYKCLSCSKPKCYFSRNGNIKSKEVKCNNYDYCGNTYLNTGVILIRHISFIDCPGHLSFMGKMIQACSVADTSLLIVDSNSKFPQPQTVNHFNTSYLLGLLTKKNINNKNNLIVCQNKIDLVNPRKACKNYEEIRLFLNKYDLKSSNYNIIPISAQSKLNIDVLCEFMINKFNKYSNNLNKMNDLLKINVIRSFDVNKPQQFITPDDFDNLKGGVIGGVILEGTLCINDEIIILPGFIRKDPNNRNKFLYQPITSIVTSIQCGNKRLKKAYPGANVGIGLNIDPFLTKADKMIGSIVIKSNTKRNTAYRSKFYIFQECIISYINEPMLKNERVKINIHAMRVGGTIIKHIKSKNVIKDDDNNNNNNNNKKDINTSIKYVIVKLDYPIAAQIGDKVAFTRKNKQATWVMKNTGVLRRVKIMSRIS